MNLVGKKTNLYPFLGFKKKINSKSIEKRPEHVLLVLRSWKVIHATFFIVTSFWTEWGWQPLGQNKGGGAAWQPWTPASLHCRSRYPWAPSWGPPQTRSAASRCLFRWCWWPGRSAPGLLGHRHQIHLLSQAQLDSIREPGKGVRAARKMCFKKYLTHPSPGMAQQ